MSVLRVNHMKRIGGRAPVAWRIAASEPPANAFCRILKRLNDPQSGDGAARWALLSFTPEIVGDMISSASPFAESETETAAGDGESS
jgi:hypothetical protein